MAHAQMTSRQLVARQTDAFALMILTSSQPVAGMVASRVVRGNDCECEYHVTRGPVRYFMRDSFAARARDVNGREIARFV
jgi:hypothetical protein